MTAYSLITQATYQEIQYALFDGVTLLKQESLDKRQASSLLMKQLQLLLTHHSITWADLDFIGANLGPAPFTTLRALITTINGISFATGISLVGVDGLKAFAQEHIQKHTTVILLNAFAGDVYFAIQEGDNCTTGWKSGIPFLEELSRKHPKKTITFIGNAVPLFQETLAELFGPRALIAHPLPEYVSLKQIAQQCFQQVRESDKETTQLTPLYLKTQEYKPSC